ncbi:MAG: TetR/AcrR family transcriptional regulator [Myxococcota bacterium]
MSAGIHPARKLAPGRRERRKQEVRARILGVARELFAKHGFEATTVDEIARAADVVPATFFNHFQSKQALLGLMAGEVFETLHSMTAQHLEGPGTSVAKLRRFIVSISESIASSRGVARDVFLEFLKSDATPDEPHPYLERVIGPFVSVIAEGQSRGEFRSDRSAAFLAQMSVGMLNSAITSWLADPDYPVEAGLADAAEFAIETLCSKPLPRANAPDS